MSETEQVLKDAQLEIGALRRRNEILEAKQDVFDGVMALLHAAPAGRGGITVEIDIWWRIDQELARRRRAVEPGVFKDVEKFRLWLFTNGDYLWRGDRKALLKLQEALPESPTLEDVVKAAKESE